MTLPKLKFHWRTQPVAGGKWLGGLFCFYDARAASAGRLRDWRLVVSLRGLLIWLSALAVVAYFTGAGVLWWWLDRRPHNHVGYADLVLPTHWRELQQKRGQAQIDGGLIDFKEHKWREGEMKLRVGLRRSPNSPEARMALSRFYLAINQRSLAKTTLTAGLAYGYPGSDYFRQICALAADGEDYDLWIHTCDIVLGQLAGKPALARERREAVQQKLAALMAADRPEEVISIVDSQGADAGAMFDEFKVLALLKVGKPADAVAFLDTWRKRDGGTSQIVRLQVRAFREAGRPGDMDHAIEELRALSPANPQPYIYGIIQQLLAGRWVKAEEWMDDFLLHFGSAQSSLVALTEPLVEIGNQRMLGEVIAHARRQGFNLQPFQSALVKVLVDKDEWRQALVLLADIRSNAKTASPERAFWYELMGRLCNAAVDAGEGTQSLLIDFVRNRQLSLKMDKELIGSLRRAGRPATARALITFAQGNYSENATLNTWRDELDKELAAVPELQPDIVLPKAPVVAGITVDPIPSRQILKEDTFFKGLAVAEKAGDYQEALKQIREMRVARPDWLVAREDMVEVEEIRLNGLEGDLPGLHLATSLYLNGDSKRSVKAGELARELYAAGCKEAAILLAKDLLRKVPDYPTARRLLAEWEPKPAAPRPADRP